MKSMTLKFGEHELVLKVSDELDLKIENGVSNETIVSVISGFEDNNEVDHESTDMTNDELGAVSEALSVKEPSDFLQDNVLSEDEQALEELKEENMSDDDKTAYDALYDSINNVPVYETNDFELKGEKPVLVDDEEKQLDGFESSINNVINVERQYLENEPQEKPTVKTESDYEDVSDEDLAEDSYQTEDDDLMETPLTSVQQTEDDDDVESLPSFDASKFMDEDE